jgi:acyl-coenzyme A synthetase/AMP-(fatty) acid ligase
MTADYVAYHAAERPHAIALIDNGRSVSYAELSRDIRKAMGALRELGLGTGGSVAVGTEHLYMHWLLLLACERLGIAAASFGQGEASRYGPLWAAVDLVLAAPEIKVTGARRAHALTPRWIKEVLAGEPSDLVVPPKHPDDPVRIVRTSGTTGASKWFLVTRRMTDSLIAQWQWGYGLSKATRQLQTLAFIVRATFDLGSASLRAGGTVVLESRTTVLDAISDHAITHVILLPIYLKDLLDQMPPEFVKPRGLTVLSFGAGIAEPLRERAMARLATALGDLYGTVEVTIVSAIWNSGAEGFGTLWPGARAEIVDERGVVVPPGVVGSIRIKTHCMATAYIDDPETTARMFRNGWFYPGDLGVLSPDGRLKILGRADDRLNIGGAKILPTTLEAALIGQDVAADIGVTALPNAEGMNELCIALAGVTRDDKETMDRIMRALGSMVVGLFRVFKLERIPRSATGKLERQALREETARALGRQ